MARTKHKRLRIVKELPNVFMLENVGSGDALKNYFGQRKNFTLEIGCGSGDYTIELAKKFPERNFIGLDLKGARVFSGAAEALKLNLKNAAFIIGKADKLCNIFTPGSIDEIFIPFPDPHIRRRNEKRRLISPQYLKIYKDLLVDSGEGHFKTDDQNFFDYALKALTDFGCKIIYASEHVYENANSNIKYGIVTAYEKYYIINGRRIKYIQFMFD
jgi:tRNA (guanine-N7-)-methyltransferase